jgi:hypothetical protein
MAVLPLTGQAVKAEPAFSPTARELRSVSDKPFPVPDGTPRIAES